jgi:DNA polymerase-3 subunit gamma/tau
VDASLAGDYASSLLLLDDVLSKGFNAQHFVAAVSSHLRDLLVSRTGGLDSLLDLPDSLKAKYKEQGGRCSVKWLYDALGVTTACEAGYRLATNPRLHIEFALMKLAFLQNAPAPQPSASSSSGSGAAAPGNFASLIPPTAAQRVPPVYEATGGHGFQEQHSATAPKKPAAESDKVDISVKQPSAESAAGRSAEGNSSVTEKIVEEKKPRRAKKSAASLSLSALMNEEEVEVMPATEEQAEGEKPLPDDEEMAAKWKDLVAMYGSQPRLANALANASLSFGEEAGRKVVFFTVTNEAQKKWIEERVLRDLEGRFAKIVDCGKIRLEPTVVPEEEQGKRIYMPSEKAEDLMSKNEEVRNLVVDLALDIK